tara:strand:+ start:560 stop:745 length:186 start_codon:yes stop_codon:yes gene_type:complete
LQHHSDKKNKRDYALDCHRKHGKKEWQEYDCRMKKEVLIAKNFLDIHSLRRATIQVSKGAI